MAQPGVVDLLILQRAVRVHCPDARFEEWMRALYQALACEAPSTGGPVAAPDLEYRIEPSAEPRGFRVQEDNGPADFAQTAGLALNLFEDKLTIALQLHRPDLLFVHSAVLAHEEQSGLALIGPSGAGKSTLAWALAQRGFEYLSDELAPFDVDALHVAPFPRAIHLKKAPPGHLSPPGTIIDTGPSLCVLAETLPGGVANASRALQWLFFLAPSPRPAVPEIRELSTGEATSRLFTNTLNALAHTAYGVDAVVRLSRHAGCYELAAADLDATCELVESVVA